MEEILYYCERCSKPVYQKIGSGRYCSQSCANARPNAKKLECQYCHKLFLPINIKKHEVSCKENLNNLQNIKLQNWIYEQHTCKKCGKIMTEYFGSGEYCSRACANSRDNIDYNKVSKSLHLYNELIGNNVIWDSTKKFCKVCGKELCTKNKTGYCNICRKSAPELKENRVNAGKKAAETRKRNGTQNSWQSRNIQSYPEKFWQKVLDNNNIKYEGPNYTLVRPDGYCWFLDFYIEINGYKVDLEIDGKQHKYEDRQISDEIRDLYLWSYGYIIYRVDWNEIKTDNGKSLMKQKINNFLEFISDLEQQIF